MSALDTLAKLSEMDPATLKPLQRVLLITDGTLTEILEAAFLERIELVKISQRMLPQDQAHPELASSPAEILLERRIVLRGASSGRNYVYAESVIAVDRLSPALRHGLLSSDVALGRLWLAHKLETFKELREIVFRPAGELSRHLDCAADAPLLARTYAVISSGRPVMIIAEHFPLDYDAR
jgi:chorismate-pyruvate lyase